jgi:transcriptional regulator with XRE-family HTH domain
MQHGARLFRLRKTLGLSADDMAAALGFAGAHRKSKLHLMEIDKRNISPFCLDKIERMEREAGINPPKNERAGNDRY